MWLLSAGLKLAQHHNYKTPCYTLMIQFRRIPRWRWFKGGGVPKVVRYPENLCNLILSLMILLTIFMRLVQVSCTCSELRQLQWFRVSPDKKMQSNIPGQPRMATNPEPSCSEGNTDSPFIVHGKMKQQLNNMEDHWRPTTK